MSWSAFPRLPSPLVPDFAKPLADELGHQTELDQLNFMWLATIKLGKPSRRAIDMQDVPLISCVADDGSQCFIRQLRNWSAITSRFQQTYQPERARVRFESRSTFRTGRERAIALTLETRRVSKGVRDPENKRTPLLTRRVTFLKSVPLRERVPADLPSDSQHREMIAVLFLTATQPAEGQILLVQILKCMVRRNARQSQWAAVRRSTRKRAVPRMPGFSSWVS